MELIYDFGLRHSENKFEKKTGLSDIPIFNVEEQKLQDKQSINILMSKYKKGFQYLYKKYANSGLGL